MGEKGTGRQECPTCPPPPALSTFLLSQQRHAAGDLHRLDGALDYLQQEVRCAAPSARGPQALSGPSPPTSWAVRRKLLFQGLMGQVPVYSQVASTEMGTMDLGGKPGPKGKAKGVEEPFSPFKENLKRALYRALYNQRIFLSKTSGEEEGIEHSASWGLSDPPLS